MTPAASRRSTRRFTAGAESPTRSPTSRKDRRASSRSRTTIRWSVLSISPLFRGRTQRITLERRRSATNHTMQRQRVERDPMSTRTAATGTATHAGTDRMPLLGMDHVELYVGSAAQASFFYRQAFGFREVAFRGLETGSR